MAQRDEASVAASADRGVSGIPAELAEARATIDNIDAALVHILAERFRCTQRVGHIKARLDLPPADPGREARQVERLRTLAASSGLDPDFDSWSVRLFVTTRILKPSTTRGRSSKTRDRVNRAPTSTAECPRGAALISWGELCVS